ncbi:hypothetical protein BN946_scf184888.g22 [Trametes cinnabarina]|uniref:HTH CENPB-type domain-containing protein n=1 Tax=Pycnoporus cinnabarinus TaxID=5643 RepID=A0A060SN59_PYCCI|nr:hypothetical protein BN946_scf184888.g22 [Trametes cinnabarina]
MGRLSKKQLQAIQHEERVTRAVEYLRALPEDQRRHKLSQTARQFQVRYDTLRRRFLGNTRPRTLAHETQQILTHSQERALVDWLIHLSTIGRPLNKRTVRKKVKHISGRNRTPLRKWLSRFLARHKELKLGKPSGLDPKRARAFNEATVERHFELLRKVMEEHQIPWEHVYNMDEKGIQRGRRNVEQTKYVLHRSERPVYKLRSANLELITVIECVRADGESLKPAFIFPGKEFHKEWFEVDPDILICMSPNGWTDDALCAEWFQHAFIPQANTQRVSDAPILLIYDGHGSHATPALVELALKNNIHLFCLPPHTTDKLQPLDVGVFAQLADAWTKRCDVVCTETDNEMRKEDVVREYMSIREEAITPHLIRSGFRACGLNPLNPHIFKPEDFAPSKVTSQHAHFPSSFLCIIQSTNQNAPATTSAEEEGDGCFRPTCIAADDTHDPDFYDELFNDKFDLTSQIGDGNLSSDEDWKSATDDEVLDDDLSTRYEATRPPVAVFRPDGTILTYNVEAPRPVSSGTITESSSLSLSSVSSRSLASSSSFSSHSSSSSQTTATTTATDSPYLQDVLKTARSAHIPSHVRFAAYEQALRTQTERISELQAQLESSTVHASMAALEVEELQQKLNHRVAQKNGKSRTLVTDSRCFTSGAGLAAWRAQEAQRAEREAMKEAKRVARERKAEEQAAQRRDLTYAYSGGLSKQLLPDLQALVQELGIALDPSVKRPTKDFLKKAIQKFFEEHPEHQEEECYCGLFTSRQAQKRPAPSDDPDENEPPMQRLRLDAFTPSSSSSSSFPLQLLSPGQADHLVATVCTPSHASLSSRWPVTALQGSDFANRLPFLSHVTPIADSSIASISSVSLQPAYGTIPPSESPSNDLAPYDPYDPYNPL